MRIRIIIFLFLSSSLCFAQKRIKVPENYKFVPMGHVKVGEETANVDAFFISVYEVSVSEYNLFLNEIKDKNPKLYNECYPDTSLWVTIFEYSYNEPYTKHYHTHPMYANYPANNISYEAAVEYCKWLTAKHNEENAKTTVAKGEFRLPSEAEWIRAARGDNHDWIFPWKEPKLKDKNGKYLANFFPVEDESVTRDHSTGKLIAKANPVDDKFFITSPVKSYYPNQFSLYNMCGNVAEMVAGGKMAKGGSFFDPGSDVRIDSPGNHHKIPSPMVGFRFVFIPRVE